MEISFANLAISETVKFATKFGLEKLTELSKRGVDIKPDFDIAIARHVKKVFHWASSYSFLGLGMPKDCQEDTIALRFNTQPRRYRVSRLSQSNDSDKSDCAVLSEDLFLESDHSVVLLGDPGAGKTTTLKRVALSLLTNDSRSSSDVFQFPILIVLKDLPRSKFICEELAEVFGVNFEKSLRLGANQDGTDTVDFGVMRDNFAISVNGIQIEDVLGDLLNSLNAVLIFDGLDELDHSKKYSIWKEIELINQRLQGSKIVLSCRSGDYTYNFNGFQVVEVFPLNEKEIINISSIWLDDPGPFLQALENTLYSDIVDRPLLLSFLLYLFSNDNELPEQPSLIYRKVVYRLLKDWDDERHIKRASKYAHFDPDRKIDFLSELAYQLTYETEKKSFSEQLFYDVYEKIYESFNLPQNEYRQVATEIETHTGIIISTGIDQFEFAHLSIQEYLCANYICRSPYPDLLKAYLLAYPSPVAVACALSSNPSLFFSEMINRQLCDEFRNPMPWLHEEQSTGQLSLQFFGENVSSLRSFLSRLKIENPFFKVDSKFGLCVLCLFAFYYRRYSVDIDTLLAEFIRTPTVAKSVVHALNGLNGMGFYLVSNETVVFEMDSWFRAIYEKVAGPWPSGERITRALPVVLFPRDFIEQYFADNKLEKLSEPNFKKRVQKNISTSAICFIEFGTHSLNRDQTCKVCGAEIRRGKIQRKYYAQK